MDRIAFQGVTTDKVDAMWPLVEDLVDKALFKAADGCYWPEDILAACRVGDMQLWVGYDASQPLEDQVELVVVTQIIIFPRKKVIQLFLVSAKDGLMKRHWWRYKPILEEFGQSHGCEAVIGYGRRGWMKKYTAEDYEVIHTVWRKNL